MIHNPILKGFCPDPSIIRAGDDYYIATSTFEWWPGVKLFHSKNLADWEQIESPLRRESQLNLLGDPNSGGVWAPCLSYDGFRYFLVYTDVKTKKGRYYNTHNYMVHTTDIRGEWSEPVYLNSIGFDPSLFHDTDGKKYLINMVNGFKGVLVQEVSFEYGSTTKKPVCHRIGEQKKVYAGSGIGCTEGPHMYHIGDWYYLIVAEGGTGYSHCVTVARAKSVFGPFETMPDNPVLTSDRENPKALQKCGHADMVETPDGEWYMVHLCARPVADTNKCTLGRETAIQKLAWTPDGWPTLADGGRYVKGIPEGRAASFEADFTAPSLPPAFVSPRASYQDFADLSSRPGYLRIHAQESMNSWHHVSLLAVHQQEWECCAQTVMECTPQYSQQLAGFTYVYDSMHFYLLAKTTDDDGNCLLTLLKSDAGVITDEMEPVPVPKDKALHLRCLVTENGKTAQFSYSFDGEEWKQAGSSLSTELVTDEHCRGFTGAHFGVYAHDLTGIGFSADFSQFTITY